MLVAEVLIHHLDTLRMLLGPLRVTAARTQPSAISEMAGEDGAVIQLKAADGARRHGVRQFCRARLSGRAGRPARHSRRHRLDPARWAAADLLGRFTGGEALRSRRRIPGLLQPDHCALRPVVARQHARSRPRREDNHRDLASGRGLLPACRAGRRSHDARRTSSTDTSAPTREEEQADVIRRLEEDIIFGRFAPGSRLVEDTLMTRYRASRHFVRQGAVPAGAAGHRAARKEHRRHRAVLFRPRKSGRSTRCGKC